MSMSLGLKFPDWSVLAQFCRSAVPGANRGETPLLQENSCNCRFNISFLASLRLSDICQRSRMETSFYDQGLPRNSDVACSRHHVCR